MGELFGGEVEGGGRNLVGVGNADIRVGTRVEVVFDDVTPEVTLPRFRPVAVYSPP